MKLIKMECPYCGGELRAQDNETVIPCPYCGMSVAVDQEIERSEKVVKIHDEAKIREAELKNRQYEEEQRRREEEKFERFKRGKAGKFTIIFMIFCVLAMMAAFMEHRILAGLVALLQVALLAVSWLISTGHIHTIRGHRVPAFLMTLLACLLVIPFSMLLNQKTFVKYIWPDTELTQRLPKPESQYGEISVSTSDAFEIAVDKTNADSYQRYLAECRTSFAEDVSEVLSYDAYDAEGYHLRLNYDKDDKQMKIRLEAPEQFDELQWPVSELASLLPSPQSHNGVVEIDTAQELAVRFAGMDKEAYRKYVDQVMEAGFTEDYKREDTVFTAYNQEGCYVEVTQHGHNNMTIVLQAPPEETPEPEVTPEAEPAEKTLETPEPTEAPAETAAPAAGVRPEFRKTMEDYEAFYDQYIDFMVKYQKSDNALAMMNDYMALLTKMSEWEKSIDSINEDELTDEELLLFNEVNLRVAGKLNQAAITMN